MVARQPLNGERRQWESGRSQNSVISLDLSFLFRSLLQFVALREESDRRAVRVVQIHEEAVEGLIDEHEASSLRYVIQVFIWLP